MRAVVQHRPAPRRHDRHELAVILAGARDGRRGGRPVRPADARWSSAAGCATGCWSASRRTWTSRCSACAGDVLRDVLGRLGRVEPVGNSFPVFKLAGLGDGAIDVALPRRESKAGRGHRGFVVEGDPTMSIADAARRRDFTVNAIAWDPLTGAYEDPFDGRADLTRRVLRAVDPATFGDDSLRVLRAVQFAARFEFALDGDTAALCRRIPLDDLAGRARLGRNREAAPAGAPALDRDGAGARARRGGPRCCRSCARWSAVRRIPSGIPKATCGCTR